MAKTAEEMTEIRVLARATLSKSIQDRFQEARIDCGPTQSRQIKERLSQMPVYCVGTYLKAMEGKSPTKAIQAFCCMCMGWDDYREGVKHCTDGACPLFPYRPYQRQI